MSEESLSPRKKKHSRRVDTEIDPEFQIAPMIDILLVLLVFFMSISSTELLQSNKDVKLPVAKDAKDNVGDAQGRFVINVLFNELAAANPYTIDIDENTYDLSQVASMLKSRVAKNPTLRVVINADKNIRYEFLRKLLETIGTAGVSSITFSVVNKEQ